jgi:hypothetical protein
VTAEGAGQLGQGPLQLLGGGDVVGPHGGPVRVGQQPAEPVRPGALAAAQPRDRVAQTVEHLRDGARALGAYRIGVDAGRLQAGHAVGGRLPVGSRLSRGRRVGQGREVGQRA